MATTSYIQIHLRTVGDITINEVVNSVPNPNSTAIVFLQSIPSNVPTKIYNPFIQLMAGGSNAAVQNVLIIPDPINTGGWNIGTSLTPPDYLLHPTNPVILPLISLSGAQEVYIYHNNGAPLVFRFFWV
jgi:hypothetical protein